MNALSDDLRCLEHAAQGYERRGSGRVSSLVSDPKTVARTALRGKEIGVGSGLGEGSPAREG